MVKANKISSKATVSKAAVGLEAQTRLILTLGMASSHRKVLEVREIKVGSEAILKVTVRSNSLSCNSNKDSRVEGAVGEEGADGRTTRPSTDTTHRRHRQP